MKSLFSLWKSILIGRFKNVSMFLDLSSTYLYFIPGNLGVSSFGISTCTLSSQITAITWPLKRGVNRNNKAPDELLFLYTLVLYHKVYSKFFCLFVLTLIFACFLYWRRTFQLLLANKNVLLLDLPNFYKFPTWNVALFMWHNVSGIMSVT